MSVTGYLGNTVAWSLGSILSVEFNTLPPSAASSANWAVVGGGLYVPVSAAGEFLGGVYPDEFGCGNTRSYKITGTLGVLVVDATVETPVPFLDNEATYLADGELQFNWGYSPSPAITEFALYDYDYFEADPFPSAVPPFWTGTGADLSYTHTDPDFSEDINYTLRATWEGDGETLHSFCNWFVAGGLAVPTYVFASVVGMPVRHPSKRQAGYTHTQSTESATWSITHNLGHPPASIRVKDADGNTLNPEIDDVTNNRTTLTFDEPYTGTAVLT